MSEKNNTEEIYRQLAQELRCYGEAPLESEQALLSPEDRLRVHIMMDDISAAEALLRQERVDLSYKKKGLDPYQLAAALRRTEIMQLLQNYSRTDSLDTNVTQTSPKKRPKK